MKKYFVIIILLLFQTSFGQKTSKTNNKNLSKATFAAGCFWCVEAVFENIKGVDEAISGYSGGHTKNPTYREVGGELTGHAESVQVLYDSSVISYPELLKVFFACQDPTQVKGQGPDNGDSYRSIAFYRNLNEKKTIENFIAELNASKKYKKPIATEVTAFKAFWYAEDYHQNYVVLNPNVPYVVHESIPRLNRTLKQVPELIK